MNFGPKERRIVKASLTVEADERLDELATEHGRTKQTLLGRLIEWFGEQSKSRRVAILDDLTEEDVAELKAEEGGRAPDDTGRPNGTNVASRVDLPWRALRSAISLVSGIARRGVSRSCNWRILVPWMQRAQFSSRDVECAFARGAD
jgi:hypothetical protein